MPICRSSGACEMWENEFYKYPAPLALRTDDVDSNDLLFAQSSFNSRGNVNNTPHPNVIRSSEVFKQVRSWRNQRSNFWTTLIPNWQTNID
jgi:hypothetical protein